VRTFRLFVSSTFADLEAERNALHTHVFPRLRQLAALHGCRFQAIDLRWGVREEAALDQQTMRICLQEIGRSQHVSPRPNFLVLLGDRYGWRPLPPAIPAEEFAHIESVLVGTEDRTLVRHWYRRDDNAVPAVYDLQPRRGAFVEAARWERVEGRLHALLRRASRGLTAHRRLKYVASATEQEIAAGALQVADADEHVIACFRAIDGVPTGGAARRFMDVDAGGRVDIEARRRLRRLKDRLRRQLPSNVLDYGARWRSRGPTTDHIGDLPPSLTDCLDLADSDRAPAT
jgi:hypothetical protein